MRARRFTLGFFSGKLPVVRQHFGEKLLLVLADLLLRCERVTGHRRCHGVKCLPGAVAGLLSPRSLLGFSLLGLPFGVSRLPCLHFTVLGQMTLPLRADQARRCPGNAGQQGEQHHRRRDDPTPVPARKLSQAVPRARRAGHHRFVVQVSPDVMRQAVGRLVAAVAFLGKRLHHDPVEFTLYRFAQLPRLSLAECGRGSSRLRRADPRARRRRVFLANHPENLIHRGPFQPARFNRGRPRQELIEYYSQGINIGARVDVDGVEAGLFGGHVQRRAQHVTESGEQRVLAQLHAGGRFRHAEVDHLGHRLAVVAFHEDVRRLQVAVDDPLLVRVLNRRADELEQVEAVADAEPVRVAVFGERHAFDQFHDEKRRSRFRRARVQQLGDVRMIHERNRLPFRLESRQDQPRRSQLAVDQLDRDPALHGLALVGHPHAAHAPATDLLEQLVATGDHRSDLGWR